MNKAHKLSILAGALLALGLAAGATAATRSTNLSLVGYSTPKTVMGKIIQAWQKTPDGSDVSFSQSYGASTDQARAVSNGLKADLVFLSTGDDVNLLVDAGLVDSKWDRQSYDGIAADTVVVFAVRNGNPKHIKSWADLVRPGIQVITPNPFSSGSAKWNILAAYAAQRHLGKTDKQATAYVKQLFEHVAVQDTSGRNATNTFLAGKGDVLITYESEAINSRLNGQDIQYVIPRQTMLIELPIAVTKSSSNKDKVNQFIRFVKGDTAQDLFAQYGFRPVDKKVLARYAGKYPARPGIFRIDDKIIGGWRAADKVWFDPNNGRMVQIERAVGDQALASAAQTARLPGDVRRRPSEGAAAALSLGFTTAYLSIIVVLPIAALVWASRENGLHAFWTVATQPEAIAALKLSLGAALIVSLINAVLGTVTAWVLVRDEFPGKQVVNSVIDLPFALPTIVAGLTLLALYGPQSPVSINIAYTRTAIVLALLFVTLPFVVRTVQPVLLELDRESEEAARSLGASEARVFRSIVLPNILPGILSGVALAFARAVGEIGALVLISGNLPYKTEAASVFVFNHIQSGDQTGASAVAVVMLSISFALLLVLGGLRYLATRHERA